jgi:hypothetical protein
MLRASRDTLAAMPNHFPGKETPRPIPSLFKDKCDEELSNVIQQHATEGETKKTGLHQRQKQKLIS